jgi:hypothetical protein
VFAFRHNGTIFPGFPIALQGLAYGMPTVCDLDQDGLAEVVVGDLTRRVYKIDLTLPIDLSRDAIEWTRLQKDLGNTGRFAPENLNGAPAASAGAGERLVAAPNPFTGEMRISGARNVHDGPWRVFDVRGRVVRSVLVGSDGALRWDGDGADGRPAGTGLYFLTPAVPNAPVVRCLRLNR